MSAVAIDEVQALHDAVMGFRHDPLGYVLFAFPWGVEGTPLAAESGPEPWQRELLERTLEDVLHAFAIGLGLPAVMALAAVTQAKGNALTQLCTCSQ